MTVNSVALLAGLLSVLRLRKERGLATPVCYITTEEGETSDLTSMCGTSTEDAELTSSSEALTREAYAYSRRGGDYVNAQQIENAIAEFEESSRLHVEAGYPERAAPVDEILEVLYRVIRNRQ
ncbi:MAG: hypothetical protein ACFBSF_14320 [Leptolyngbyaceae cyanobacterium]